MLEKSADSPLKGRRGRNGRSNCKTDENPEGLLALEKSQYLANFEIKRNELMSMIDKDLALWDKNFAQVEKMKDMM